MKKFKWPWSGKKKKVKRASIDLSEFKEDLEPWLVAYRAINRARIQLEDHFQIAHAAFWKKINEIVGYDLPGGWTFNTTNFMVIPKGDDEKESSEEVPTLSEYEEFWKKMQETFYHLRGSGL